MFGVAKTGRPNVLAPVHAAVPAPTPATPVAPVHLLDGRIAAMLDGVHPGYLPMIDKKRLGKILLSIKTPADRLSPQDDAIFEWLRYAGPQDIVGVLCGQDPYPEHAQGLCFSKHRALPIPASFRNIAKCLKKQFGFECAHADLRTWAVQGLLMPNDILTTEIHSSLAHSDAWKGFVTDLVGQIAAARDAGSLFFMLWGNYAIKHLKPVAERAGHTTLEWSHPSPVGDNRQPPAKKFENCDSFAKARAFVDRPFCWDNSPTILAFADGACSKNGSRDAVAGFGVLVLGGQFGATRLRGRVPAAPITAVRAAATSPGPFIAPTNNRAELLALCWTMRALCAGCATGRVIILSDSKIYVNLLAGGLAKHRGKKTDGALLNPDLLTLAWGLMECLKSQTAGCEFHHVPAAHNAKLPKDATPLQRLIWKGNDAVDALAKQAVAEPSGFELETGLPGLAHRLAL